MSSSDEGTRKSETLGKRFQGGCRAPFTPTPLLTLNHQEPDSRNHWKSITCLATYRQRPDRKTLVQNKLTWGLSSQNTRKFRRAWKVSRILPRFDDGLVFPYWFIVDRLKIRAYGPRSRIFSVAIWWKLKAWQKQKAELLLSPSMQATTPRKRLIVSRKE